jgi:hypothetical protein
MILQVQVKLRELGTTIQIGKNGGIYSSKIMLRGRELRPTCEIMHLLLRLLRVSDYIFTLR